MAKKQTQVNVTASGNLGGLTLLCPLPYSQGRQIGPYRTERPGRALFELSLRPFMNSAGSQSLTDRLLISSMH